MTRQTDGPERNTLVAPQHRRDDTHRYQVGHDQVRRRAARRLPTMSPGRATVPMSWLGLLYRTLSSWAMCLRLLLIVVVLVSVIVGGLYLLRVELGPFLITRG